MANGNKEAYVAFSASLPSTVKGALQSPRISDLKKAVDPKVIALAVEYELVVLNSLVSVGNKMSDFQIQAIAQHLVEESPAESIADFKVCFRRGAMGAYGDIFRLDGVVIGTWLSKYYDEKYELHVDQLAKERDDLYKVPEKPKQESNINIWEEFQKLHGSVGHKIPAMDDDMIKHWGQEKPPQKQSSGHRPMTPEEVEEWHRQKEARLQAAKNARLAELREKHPTLTAEELNRLL